MHGALARHVRMHEQRSEFGAETSVEKTCESRGSSSQKSSASNPPIFLAHVLSRGTRRTYPNRREATANFSSSFGTLGDRSEGQEQLEQQQLALELTSQVITREFAIGSLVVADRWRKEVREKDRAPAEARAELEIADAMPLRESSASSPLCRLGRGQRLLLVVRRDELRCIRTWRSLDTSRSTRTD